MKGHRGTFVTFEGGEGAGKGTQLHLLRSRLDQLGISHVDVREPGGTKISEHVRSLLLDPEIQNFSPRAELLLYGAARAQIVDEIIEPALASGQNVLCDRFYDSTSAYQGSARGLDRIFIATMRTYATNGLNPDLTVYLDIDPGIGLERATDQGADRIEQESIEFHRRVRKGYRAIGATEPERFKVIDASGKPDEVEALVWEHIGPLFMKGR